MLSLVLIVLMLCPFMAQAGTTGEKGSPVVISNLPNDSKISIGRGEEAQVGTKGAITRNGKDIAKFEITSVEWGYSSIKVSDLASGESIRIGDGVRVTDVPAAGQKIGKKKSGAGVLLGALLVIGGLIALGGKHGGGSSSGGGDNSIALTSDSPTLPANGTSSATITASIVDSHNAAVPDGTTVQFAANSGTIAPATTTTSGGKATATLTAGTSTGTCTVTATSGGKTKSMTVSLVSGGAAIRSVALLVDKPSIEVLNSGGLASTATITATCREANGQPATTGSVTFTSSIGTITPTAAIGSNGIATATLSSNNIGDATVTASWQSAQATIPVKVTGGAPHTMLVDCAPASIEADGNSFASITATVKDILGNPVADGTTVNFSVTGDSSGGGNGTIASAVAVVAGKATAFLYSRDGSGAASRPGTATVTATVDAAQAAGITPPTQTVRNDITRVQFVTQQVEVAAISLQIDNSPADSIPWSQWRYAGTGGPASTIKYKVVAAVRDVNHNPVADGTAVYFTSTPGMIYGDSGTSDRVTVSTTKSGTATATLVSDYQQGGAIPASVRVTVRVGQQTGALEIPIIQQSGGGGTTVSRTLQLSANPAYVQILGSSGGVTSSTITATCQENGQPAQSGTVTFSASKGTVIGTAPVQNGIATTTFNSNTVGDSTITATWGGTQASIPITVTSGPPYLISVQVNPGAIECDGHSFATVSATVKDISGNPVTDGTSVSFAVTHDVNGGGDGTITPEARTSNGVATALIFSRNAGNLPSKAGTATVVVGVERAKQSAGIPLPDTDLVNHKTQVQFTSLDVSQIRIGASPLNIRGWDYVGRTSTVTAVVYDSNHNPVPDGTAVYFSANHGMIYGDAGSVGAVALSTTKLGMATATLMSDASGDGTWHGLVDVTATSGSQTITVPGQVIFSGWPSIPHCSAVMEPTTLASVKDSAVITVVALDVNGNPVVDGTVVKVETTKGTLSSTSPTTLGGIVQVTLKTSDDTQNPTQSGAGIVKILIDSGGHNPETGGQPVPLQTAFTVQ